MSTWGRPRLTAARPELARGATQRGLPSHMTDRSLSLRNQAFQNYSLVWNASLKYKGKCVLIKKLPESVLGG